MQSLKGCKHKSQFCKRKLKEVNRIYARCKEQAGKKRLVLKNKIVVSTEEVHKVLKEEGKGNKYKRWKRQLTDKSEESFTEILKTAMT